MPNAEEDALRAIRAASTALQEKLPEDESPRSWRGVEPACGVMPGVMVPARSWPYAWSLRWSGDRLKVLNLSDSGLEVLAPQIGQLTALTHLILNGCTLKELPPQIGQLLALGYLDLDHCNQLTLAPGAEVGQPAQTIVAAYVPLLIVEADTGTIR